MTELSLIAHACYRVDTHAGRRLYLMFRGRRGRRLAFTNLDAPYEDVFLRPAYIKSTKQIGGSK